MTREQLIESAAKAIYLRRNGHGGTPWENIHTQHREPYRKDVRAVMSAIEVAGPCIVPVDATEAMLDAALEGDYNPLDVYRAMIEAGRI